VTKTRFGIRLPVSGPFASLNNVISIAKKAEELEYDSIWVHDHVQWTREMHEHHISSGSAEALRPGQEPTFLESMTLLSHLSAYTNTILLGVACLAMPCRNPVHIAKQAANVDHLSNGRLILGVGLGSRATVMSKEFEIFDVPLKGRGDRMLDFVKAMKVLWSEPYASYDGEYVAFKNAEMYPKPLQEGGIPVWVGGWSNEAARRTASVGDGWIPGWLSPDEMRLGVDLLRDELTRNGRSPKGVTIAVEKYLHVGKASEDVTSRAQQTISQSLYTYERQMKNYPEAEKRHIIGSPEEVARRIGEYIDAGVEHFEFKVIYSSLDNLNDQMIALRDEVLR